MRNSRCERPKIWMVSGTRACFSYYVCDLTKASWPSCWSPTEPPSSYVGLAVSDPSLSIPQAVQAAIPSFISSENLGAAYSVAAALDLAGGVAGGLISAELFKLGLHVGGEAAWGLGLLFWTSAVHTISCTCPCTYSKMQYRVV